MAMEVAYMDSGCIVFSGVQIEDKPEMEVLDKICSQHKRLLTTGYKDDHERRVELFNRYGPEGIQKYWKDHPQICITYLFENGVRTKKHKPRKGEKYVTVKLLVSDVPELEKRGMSKADIVHWLSWFAINVCSAVEGYNLLAMEQKKEAL